jgi:DNA repair protein RadA
VEAQFGELEIPGDAAADASASGAGGDEASVDGESPVAEAEAADTPVPYTLAGIGEKTVRKLVDAGFVTQDAVAAATLDQLSDIAGIGEKTAEKILAAARGEASASGQDV